MVPFSRVYSRKSHIKIDDSLYGNAMVLLRWVKRIINHILYGSAREAPTEA